MRIAFWLAIAWLACGCDGGDGGSPRPDGSAPPAMATPRIERYLRADPDPRLVIELDYVEGTLPREAAQSDLVARLSTLLDKPEGVEIVLDDVIPSRGADYAWTFEALQALATETFDDDQPAGTVSMHVMWLDGHDDDDSADGAVLGLAWANTHVAMYHSTIESSCRGGPVLGAEVCAQAQYLVWLHEVGHTIGLVDNGLPMASDHRDPDMGRHDVSEECIMYWAFEGRAGVDLIRDRILGGSLPDFDDECLADVAAVRDR
ncbi:MAG: hypothetical protein RLO52_11065 [Sandaracinaceae bacterium]